MAGGTGGERIVYDAPTDSFRETGENGRTMIYLSLVPSSRHAAGSSAPQNPDQTWKDGQPLLDASDTGITDDAVAGFGRDLGTLAPGQAAWYGVALVYSESGSPDEVSRLVATATEALRAPGPEALLAREQADWESFVARAALPADLSDDELAIARQQLVFLRMGQVAEPSPDGRVREGAFPASLWPGTWDITWIRDSSYALVGLTRTGYVDMARKGLLFFASGRAGNYVCCDAQGGPYVGRPYAISVARYSGDGEEETDFNQDGPNVELDGGRAQRDPGVPGRHAGRAARRDRARGIAGLGRDVAGRHRLHRVALGAARAARGAAPGPGADHRPTAALRRYPAMMRAFYAVHAWRPG